MNAHLKSFLPEEAEEEELLKEQEVEEEVELVKTFAIIADQGDIYPMNAQKNNLIIPAIFASKKDIRVMTVLKQRTATLIQK